MDEKNVSLPYLFQWLGYSRVQIPYKRLKREIGKSSWSFPKRFKLMIDSIIGFSSFPIRLIAATGIILGILSFIFGIWLIIGRLLGYVEMEGWASLAVLILFLGAFQMIALGIIGEYVVRTLDASKNRPTALVDEVFGPEHNETAKKEDSGA
jgi:dolichol-phosphate mannosyltransferase